MRGRTIINNYETLTSNLAEYCSQGVMYHSRGIMTNSLKGIRCFIFETDISCRQRSYVTKMANKIRHCLISKELQFIKRFPRCPFRFRRLVDKS